MSQVVVIELWPHTDFCCVCEQEVLTRYGLPMYEDEILPADWPGEWGGFAACKRCYDTFTDIKKPIRIDVARAAVAGREFYGS